MTQEQILLKLEAALNCVPESEKKAQIDHISDVGVEILKSNFSMNQNARLLLATEQMAIAASEIAIKRTLYAVSVVLAECLQEASSQLSSEVLQ